MVRAPWDPPSRSALGPSFRREAFGHGGEQEARPVADPVFALPRSLKKFHIQSGEHLFGSAFRRAGTAGCPELLNGFVVEPESMGRLESPGSESFGELFRDAMIRIRRRRAFRSFR